MYYSTDSKEHKQNMADLADKRTDEQRHNDAFWAAQDSFWDRHWYAEKCDAMIPNGETCNCGKCTE